MIAHITIEQIAEIAHVSRSTVSRVLNNHPSVRPAVRDRVLQVIDEYHYAPRAAARSLARQRTNVICLLIPRNAAIIFADLFFSHVIQSITETCAKLGYFLMLSMVTTEKEQDFYKRILLSRQFDGLIMLSSDINDPILPLLIHDNIPLVLVGRHPYSQNLEWVDAENRQGAQQAVAHLIALGHRTIATITGSLQMISALDRRDGYTQALQEAGIAVNPQLIVESDFTQEGGYRAMQSLLRLAPRPSAVFVSSDTMALGAFRAIQERGMDIPNDIALVGFDDLHNAAFTAPALTTIHQPIYEMGAAAAQQLIDQLEGRPHDQRQRSLPTRLVIRDSCGASAARERIQSQ